MNFEEIFSLFRRYYYSKMNFQKILKDFNIEVDVVDATFGDRPKNYDLGIFLTGSDNLRFYEKQLKEKLTEIFNDPKFYDEIRKRKLEEIKQIKKDILKSIPELQKLLNEGELEDE